MRPGARPGRIRLLRRCYVGTDPRCRFTIRDSDRFDDEDGVTLPDDLTARTHAIRMIQELQKANEADWAGYTMEVTRDGQLVWEIPFEMTSADPHSA